MRATLRATWRFCICVATGLLGKHTAEESDVGGNPCILDCILNLLHRFQLRLLSLFFPPFSSPHFFVIGLAAALIRYNVPGISGFLLLKIKLPRLFQEGSNPFDSF